MANLMTKRELLQAARCDLRTAEALRFRKPNLSMWFHSQAKRQIREYHHRAYLEGLARKVFNGPKHVNHWGM